jgi:hypothetical protein
MSRVVLVIEGRGGFYIASYFSGPLNALKCNLLVSESTGLEWGTKLYRIHECDLASNVVPHTSCSKLGPYCAKGRSYAARVNLGDT